MPRESIAERSLSDAHSCDAPTSTSTSTSIKSSYQGGGDLEERLIPSARGVPSLGGSSAALTTLSFDRPLRELTNQTLPKDAVSTQSRSSSPLQRRSRSVEHRTTPLARSKMSAA
jgi:hypothetical protein